MKTKDIILATAKEMISEVGFHKATTANLAKKANISEGTIYRHFESKEDILLHILDALEEQFSYYIEAIRKKLDVKDCSLEEIMTDYFSFVEANEVDMKIMLSTYGLLDSSKRLMAVFLKNLELILEESLRHGIERGEIKDVDVERNATVVMTIIFGLTRMHLYWPDVRDVREEAIEFCRRSLMK
ncbi:TetR/AcrR family transcriptional regulator [Maridesulfovibrio hydrothermalis]|uniref:Transcriptional regulator, TetR family n=1 Tax=Maridesulfovibrio hydrothermalis AM13 = DSM 14728 TaxID=1121451 RepID=L0R8R1_9BACT|nr:TetR/AcrR family transcriptional regulator [Maridesulfovibrio hydrothermalis]CCO22565.1 Transcriptional regulator, TetR family [Maridesulfovibrio hydrothermalis AM13 = DSM 14728]